MYTSFVRRSEHVLETTIAMGTSLVDFYFLGLGQRRISKLLKRVRSVRWRILNISAGFEHLFGECGFFAFSGFQGSGNVLDFCKFQGLAQRRISKLLKRVRSVRWRILNTLNILNILNTLNILNILNTLNILNILNIYLVSVGF